MEYSKKKFSNRDLKVILVIFLLLSSSLVFSLYMTQRHLFTPADAYNNQEWLTGDMQSLGTFLTTNNEKMFISKDDLLEMRIVASTGIPSPKGGYLLSDALASGMIKKDSLKIKIKSISKINSNSKGFFELQEIPPEIVLDPINIVILNNQKEMNDKKVSFSVIYDNGINSVAKSYDPNRIIISAAPYRNY